MSRLNKQKIRSLVIQELAKVVGEDTLVNRVKDMNRDTGYDDIQRVKKGNAVMHDTCRQCGSSEVYEGDCMECGYSRGGMLEEGDCGCGSCPTCGDNDMDNDFIPDHLEHGMQIPNPRPDHDFLEDDITHIVMGALGGQIDNGQLDGHKYQNNNYMAKPSLYKVAKYAQKLLQMIPDGYELDDWQRTKIAQISDDISEVYHSLDYDFYDDEF